MAWTLLCLGVVLADIQNIPLRTVLALPVMFIFPGYAFHTVIFTEDRLNTTERFAYTIGLSFSFTILGGFVIYLSPWTLTPVPWMVYFTVIIVLFSVIAMIKRFSVDSGEPLSYNVVRNGSRTEYGLFVVAILIIGVAIWGSRLANDNRPHNGFSELWMIPQEEQDTIIVEVGFRSYEQHITTYHIEVLKDDEILLDETNIELVPSESWKVEFSVPKDVFPDEMVARLYLVDEPTTVYREVNLYPHWRWYQNTDEVILESGG